MGRLVMDRSLEGIQQSDPRALVLALSKSTVCEEHLQDSEWEWYVLYGEELMDAKFCPKGMIVHTENYCQ